MALWTHFKAADDIVCDTASYNSCAIGPFYTRDPREVTCEACRAWLGQPPPQPAASEAALRAVLLEYAAFSEEQADRAYRAYTSDSRPYRFDADRFRELREGRVAAFLAARAAAGGES